MGRYPPGVEPPLYGSEKKMDCRAKDCLAWAQPANEQELRVSHANEQSVYLCGNELIDAEKTDKRERKEIKKTFQPLSG
jgi:hypothetical protein